MKNEIKNKPQISDSRNDKSDSRNDKKTKQDVVPTIRFEKISESRHTANVRPSDEPHPAAPAAAHFAQQPNIQQNYSSSPQGNRSIRSWVESMPDRN